MVYLALSELNSFVVRAAATMFQEDFYYVVLVNTTPPLSCSEKEKKKTISEFSFGKRFLYKRFTVILFQHLLLFIKLSICTDQKGRDAARWKERKRNTVVMMWIHNWSCKMEEDMFYMNSNCKHRLRIINMHLLKSLHKIIMTIRTSCVSVLQTVISEHCAQLYSNVMTACIPNPWNINYDATLRANKGYLVSV